MPYCPKCDMEFVEGVTVCTDCGGPLYESKEAAMEAIRKEQEKELKEQAEALSALYDAEEDEIRDAEKSVPVHAYVGKDTQYEDMRSSASAFYIVGVILAVFTVLTLTGVIPLFPAGAGRYLFCGLAAVMAIICFVVGFSSGRSAGKLKVEADDEKKETDELISWFLSNYSADDIDALIRSEEPDLSEEEMDLRRFDIIEDFFVTERDLPDPAYVDELCDEVYSRLYES